MRGGLERSASIGRRRRRRAARADRSPKPAVCTYVAECRKWLLRFSVTSARCRSPLAVCSRRRRRRLRLGRRYRTVKRLARRSRASRRRRRRRFVCVSLSFSLPLSLVFSLSFYLSLFVIACLRLSLPYPSVFYLDNSCLSSSLLSLARSLARWFIATDKFSLGETLSRDERKQCRARIRESLKWGPSTKTTTTTSLRPSASSAAVPSVFLSAS